MLKAINKILPLKNILIRLQNDVIEAHAIKSYSQEGEGVISRRIFEGKDTGYYVDLGAHHQRRFSNTHCV